MSEFSEVVHIDAPVSEVWRVLADIGAIHLWNPGVMSSYTTTSQARGIGASRHCELGGKNYLREDVVAWEPESRLTMRIVDTNLPFEAADIRFTLRAEDAGTVVTVSPAYTLKFGPVGKALDWMYVRSR